MKEWTEDKYDYDEEDDQQNQEASNDQNQFPDEKPCEDDIFI